MLRNTRAVVIHTFPYSDSSVIVRAYTEHIGFSSFLLKGFKKNRKQKALIHPLAIIELSFNEKNNSSLHLARSISSNKPHSYLLLNPIKAGIAMFLSECLGHTIKEDEEGDQQFFSWLVNAIDLLNTTIKDANFHLWFLIELSKFMGFGPQGTRTEYTPLFCLKEGSFVKKGANSTNLSDEESILFNQLVNGKYKEIIEMELSKKERSNLLHLLHEYFQLHLDKEFKLKSLDVLKQLYD